MRAEHHGLASAADGRIPAEELGKGHSVLGPNRGASIALDDEVELVAVLGHVVLDRRGRDNTICGCGDGWWFGSDRCAPNQAHAVVDTQLKHLAVAPNGWVPGKHLFEANAVLLGDSRASIALGNKVELVAVFGHIVWDWRGCYDAVCGCGDGRRFGSDGCAPNQTHAVVDTQLKHLAVAPNGWVPGKHLFEADAVFLGDSCAAVALGNKVEFVAALCHALADGRGCCHTISGSGGWFGRCGGDDGIRNTIVLLDAV